MDSSLGKRDQRNLLRQTHRDRRSELHLIENSVSELVKHVRIPVPQLQESHDALECGRRGILFRPSRKYQGTTGQFNAIRQWLRKQDGSSMERASDLRYYSVSSSRTFKYCYRWAFTPRQTAPMPFALPPLCDTPRESAPPGGPAQPCYVYARTCGLTSFMHFCMTKKSLGPNCSTFVLKAAPRCGNFLDRS